MSIDHNFNLSIRPVIEELSENVLDTNDLEQIEILSNQLLSKRTQEEAIERLRELVGNRPKRPVYYIGMHMKDLPENTRTIVFYAGSYIDCLMKHVSHEKGKNIFRALFTSLKQNIKWSKEILGPELTDNLSKFENLIYTPAKHDYENRENRHHLFSSKEVVAICFITMKLAKQLINLSAEAKAYSLDKKF